MQFSGTGLEGRYFWSFPAYLDRTFPAGLPTRAPEWTRVESQAIGFPYRNGAPEALLAAAVAWYQAELTGALGRPTLASLYGMVEFADKEQALEDKLVATLGSPRMRGIVMDVMERWRRLGGSHYVAGPLWYTPVGCTLPNNCGSFGLMRGPSDTASPRLAAFRDFVAGAAGPLPFTSAEVAQVPRTTCSPACVWGACIAGVCRCFAGASGPACATLGPKPSDCVASGP